jgi:hypothetical protein
MTDLRRPAKPRPASSSSGETPSAFVLCDGADMEPEPESQVPSEGLGTEAFSSNMMHHMVLQATAQEGREPTVLTGGAPLPGSMRRRVSLCVSHPHGVASVRRDVPLPGD